VELKDLKPYLRGMEEVLRIYFRHGFLYRTSEVERVRDAIGCPRVRVEETVWKLDHPLIENLSGSEMPVGDAVNYILGEIAKTKFALDSICLYSKKPEKRYALTAETNQLEGEREHYNIMVMTLTPSKEA
jgi:hypothetical protein